MPNTVKKIRIKRWLNVGEFDNHPKPRDTYEVLNQAGVLLDRSASYDILGPAVFEAEDGQFYFLTVEAMILPCSKEGAKRLAEIDK